MKEQSKVDSAKKEDSSVAAKSAVDNKEVNPGRSKNNMSPPKCLMQTVVPAENWETLAELVFVIRSPARLTEKGQLAVY